MQNIKSARHQISSLQWKRCFARVSFGINSATSNLSSPSQQQPIRLASRSFRSCPTILASSCIQPKPRSQTKFPKKNQLSNNRNLPQIENYQELPWIRPSHAVEPLHRDLPVIFQHPSVDDVRGLLSVLRDDVLWCKSRRHSTELLKAVLGKARQSLLVIFPSILCKNNRNGNCWRVLGEQIWVIWWVELTEIGGLQSSWFEVGGPPTKSELRAAGTHYKGNEEREMRRD